MIGNVLTNVFGSKNDRILKKLRPIVEQINSLEPDIQKLDDAALRAKTVEFRERFSKGESLDDLLPEAFAVVREAGFRVLDMRAYDVQLVGGIILYRGCIAEMKTGEGKTLVATLPVYLNALSGKGAHVVTVNDYLARRDSEWMGEVYRFLGMSVGSILHGMDDAARREAYFSDITYGTNNEFGFDYLRDNMKFDLADFCQREFNFAIVDEVDSILIDEARTPLIISGPSELSTGLYKKVDSIMHKFKEEVDYTVDEKDRIAAFTEDGVFHAEKLLGLDNIYDPKNIEYLHHINQSLKAHSLFKKDVDYIVRDGEVVIVDEFTGRTMPGRRFSDGLHQALEAKEGVKVEQENQTLASITFQNFFRMYDTLAGMTGTADTEAAEFKKIYNLDVVIVPTHEKVGRVDYADVIYKNAAAKYRAVVREIKEMHAKGRPVLVGTINIDISEHISSLLKKENITHSVLNAKHHEREAEIIAEAGHEGKVTIATNMAGRGTDIKLGEGVAELGGLHILATSRHESRRIDNQLRGRSGRQGDAGSSRFYLSLEDDLLRIFGSDRIAGIMQRLGMEEDEPIEHSMITRAIESAQRKVEGHNFDIRKHLLEYDDVMNKQREIIYTQRRTVLQGEDIKEVLAEMISDAAAEIAAEVIDANLPPEDWNWALLDEKMAAAFGVSAAISADERQEISDQILVERLQETARAAYAEREKALGPENTRHLERVVLLQVVDSHWKEHLLNMDHLKEGIGLRGYGQKDPLDEYKREGYEMFVDLMESIKRQAVATMFMVRLVSEDEVDELEQQRREQQQAMEMNRSDEETARKPITRDGDKIGRNAPCPCGSGKKYKRCCGRAK
ncbi:MAG: preprotein translocase subunit SecA [Deltaproteobacteria bacterium]|nr:preprotein translocase subunit SecA [Deltaproteobacteria bacterium]